jgi:hypothetical protein
LVHASGQRHVSLRPIAHTGRAEAILLADVDVDRVKLLRRVHLREVLTDHAEVDPEGWADFEDASAAGDTVRSVGEAHSHPNHHCIAYLQSCRHLVMLGVVVPPRKKQPAPAVPFKQEARPGGGQPRAKKAAKVEPCVYHPPGRIIGGHCMVCDNPVAAKK